MYKKVPVWYTGPDHHLRVSDQQQVPEEVHKKNEAIILQNALSASNNLGLEGFLNQSCSLLAVVSFPCFISSFYF